MASLPSMLQSSSSHQAPASRTKHQIKRRRIEIPKISPSTRTDDPSHHLRPFRKETPSTTYQTHHRINPLKAPLLGHPPPPLLAPPLRRRNRPLPRLPHPAPNHFPARITHRASRAAAQIHARRRKCKGLRRLRNPYVRRLSPLSTH